MTESIILKKSFMTIQNLEALRKLYHEALKEKPYMGKTHKDEETGDMFWKVEKQFWLKNKWLFQLSGYIPTMTEDMVKTF